MKPEMKMAGDVLDTLTIAGELFEALPGNEVRCFACGHRCLIRPGRRGICQVRYNQEGILKVPWGYVAALQADPVEKKPFFHFLPGSDALTFGMLGCDFHCANCQNWFTSQMLQDPRSNASVSLTRMAAPEQIIDIALKSGSKIIASSYNEPLITSEWSVSIFRLAVKKGLKCAYVSNGNATPEVLEYLKPYLSAYKIDLKTMQQKQYRKLGGVLENVLETIRLASELGIWVEVVTLVIPGFNDSSEELWEAASYIRSVSADIPWHVTAFHPDYKMDQTPATPARTLLRAAEIGEEVGLNFVYAGNIPGKTKGYEHTRCPNCLTRLITRIGYVVTDYTITSQGECPNCGKIIPGIWTDQPEIINLDGSGMPRFVV